MIQSIYAVLILLPVLVLSACGGGGTLPSSSSSGTVSLVQVSLTPNTPPTLATGGTRQLAATGVFSDGSSTPLTSGLTWSSNATSVATVSSSGLVTAVGLGTATITVTDGSHSASVNVSVAAQAATLSSITLSQAASGALNIGSTRQLTATGTYSDGGTATLNSGLTWSSGTPATASVSSSGVVTALAAGSTSITASEGGVTSTPLSITVQAVPVNLTSITLSPASVPSLHITGTQQFTATGHYSDGSTASLSSGITWASDNTSFVTINSSGLATAVAPGVANITATAGGVTSAMASVTVAASPVPGANAQVFYGGQYPTGVSFVPFGGSNNSIHIDSAQSCPGTGTAALRIDFAASGYTGGALVDGAGPRSLAAYDALVLYAKASSTLLTDKFGLGNNGTTTSGYEAERPAISLTTSWQQFVVPIPDASKLAAPGIDGLFHFADGSNHSGSMWICDAYYTSLGTAVLGAPVPTWNQPVKTIGAGGTYQIGSPDYLSANWTGGTGGALFDNIINYGYFSFTPSNANATVNASGLITGHNAGSSAVTSTITASLQGHASSNVLTLTVNPAPVVPPPSAPPAVPASLTPSAVAMFDSSNTATPVAGLSFQSYGGSNEADVTLGGAVVRSFAGLSYSFIQLAGSADISAKTTMHFDVYTTGGVQFGFKLVFFAPPGPGVTAEAQVVVTPTSSPALTTGAWVSYDIPFSAFTTADGKPLPSALDLANLQQIGILGNTPDNTLSGTANFWIDNLYFH